MKTLARFSLASLLSLVPAVATAAAPPTLWIYCGNLPGCPSTWQEHFSDVLRLLLVRLPDYVYALGVLFIMIGGAYMVLSAGNSENVTKGKNTITWAVIGIVVMEFAQTLVGYVAMEVNSRTGGSDLVIAVTTTLMGTIFDLLYVAILGVAIFCGMRMVMSFGKEDEFNKAREGLFWCAVGAIIINMAQVIANAFQTL